MFGYKYFHSIIPDEHSLRVLIISFAISLASVVALILSYVFYIDLPFWSATTVFATVGLSYTVTMYKTWRRVVSTIVGSLIGMLLAMLLIDLDWLGILLIFSLGSYFLYLSKRTSKTYFFLFVGLHINFIGAAIMIQPNLGYSLVEYRILSNIVGALCIIGLLYFLRLPKTNLPTEKLCSINESSSSYAIRVSLSMFIAVIFWQVMNVPGGTINMVITIIIIANISSEVKGSLVAGWHKFLGSLLGLICGISIIAISSYFPILIFFLFTITCTCFMYYHFLHKKYGYVGIQAARALVIVCFPSISENFDFYDGSYRALGIVIGIIIFQIVLLLEFMLRKIFSKIEIV